MLIIRSGAEVGKRWDGIKVANNRALSFTTMGGVMAGASVAGVAVGIAVGIVLLSTGGAEGAEIASIALTPGGIELRGAP